MRQMNFCGLACLFIISVLAAGCGGHVPPLPPIEAHDSEPALEAGLGPEAVNPDAPLPPTNLQAWLITPTRVDLYWDDASSNEDGFKIARRKGSGRWSVIATVGPSVTNYQITYGLVPGKNYSFMVIAFNSSGKGKSEIVGVTSPPTCIDLDSDGRGAGCLAGGDCDDTTATGAACFGGCWTFYADVDADAYGDPASSVTRCAAPSGYVANNTDCNPSNGAHWSDCGSCTDLDADNHGPGCNLGADCDDSVATGAGCFSGCLTSYNDVDLDTYGDPATSVTRCTIPAGNVTNGTDCNDAIDTTHPGAAELCDGRDNQCAGDAGYGTVDEGCPASTDLLSPTMDWRPQDYPNSRGITGVQYSSTLDLLYVYCDLVGGNTVDGKTNGEILLDLKYVPWLEQNLPVNVAGLKVKLQIELPAGLRGSLVQPNGLQLFVKDASQNWTSQYGGWNNIGGAGVYTIEFSPTLGNLRHLGFKIGFISSAPSNVYQGRLIIRTLMVTPELPFFPPFSSLGSSPVSTPALLVGGNWRVIEYRQNFGAIPEWFPEGNGVSHHPSYIQYRMALYRRAGIRKVRVGLLDDAAMMTDIDGHVTGYSPRFRSDVKNFLDAAQSAGIMVEFNLVDYLVAWDAEQSGTNPAWLKGRREIIEDPATREEFMLEFVAPFLAEFGSHPALYGIDIINEPEWIVDPSEGGGDAPGANPPVARADVRAFIAEVALLVRVLAPGKLVTVGASCNYYSALLSGLNLDYYAPHYYPTMGDPGACIDLIPDDKPWALEEFAGVDPGMTIAEYLDLVVAKGGFGADIWNLSPALVGDSYTYPYASEEQKLMDIRDWVVAHP